MLKIKKQLYFDKTYLYGVLIFLIGFAGALAILTTFVPFSSVKDSAYILDTPKEVTPVAVSPETVATDDSSDQSNANTYTAPTTPVYIQPSEPVQTTPQQPQTPVEQTPIIIIPPVVTDPVPPIDPPADPPVGTGDGEVVVTLP